MRPVLVGLSVGLAVLAHTAEAQAQPARDTLPAIVVTASESMMLTVENQRRVPVRLVLRDRTGEHELGVVPPGRTAELPLPQWAVRAQPNVVLVAYARGEGVNFATSEFRLQRVPQLAMVVPAGRTLPPLPDDTMMAVIPAADQGRATLTVDNPRAEPVTILTARGTVDVPLGRVPARTRATLRFPDATVNTGTATGTPLVVFVRSARGGSAWSSRTIRVRPGDHLGLRVPPQ